MSAASSSLRLAARRCHCSSRSRQSSLQSFVVRSFTTSTTRFEDTTPSKPTAAKEAPSELSPTSKADELSPDRWASFEKTFESLRHGELAGFSARIVNNHMSEEQRRRPTMVRPTKPTPGLLNMGEAPADSMDDPEFEEDDVSSLAHAQLDQHREYRHYARLMAWEMPLLTNMAKPFVPPNQNQILRFRYTTYMGEEHPAEKKVVVEFCPDDIPGLSPVEKDKLKKLVGVRYNPSTEIVKMSSEMFESQAQNKRYLGDLVDSLVREAKDPTDTFEDVPLDTRHHTFKTKPKFPREWRITPERQAQLEAERVEALRLDQAKMEEGLFIDGGAIIRDAHDQAAERAGAARLEEAAMPVPIGKGGKGPKRVSIRR